MRYRIRKSLLSESYVIEIKRRWWHKEWEPTNYTHYGNKAVAEEALKDMCSDPQDITYYNSAGQKEYYL